MLSLADGMRACGPGSRPATIRGCPWIPKRARSWRPKASNSRALSPLIHRFHRLSRHGFDTGRPRGKGRRGLVVRLVRAAIAFRPGPTV